MSWETIGAILGVLFAVSWGIIFSVCGSLWRSVLKVKRDYVTFMADGILTDAERMHLADDVIFVIQNSASLFQFIINLIATINTVIPKAVSKRARKIKII